LVLSITSHDADKVTLCYRKVAKGVIVMKQTNKKLVIKSQFKNREEEARILGALLYFRNFINEFKQSKPFARKSIRGVFTLRWSLIHLLLYVKRHKELGWAVECGIGEQLGSS